jgi:peroxiredoxin (alkyl hydroperoxide reductase subunit C)
MSLQVGDTIPEFKLYNYDKNAYEDKDFLGKKTMFVFLPFPFSSVCDKEICELRDNKASLEENGTDTVLITVGASPTNSAWAAQNGIEYPILADFWPHGEVSQKFGCFHEKAGISLRYSYITDENNVITEIIKSDEIGVERDFSEYKESFGF